MAQDVGDPVLVRGLLGMSILGHAGGACGCFFEVVGFECSYRDAVK